VKIAVIDHIGNHGGGSRVVRSLLPALKRVGPLIELAYFGNPAAIRRERLVEEFAPVGIPVIELKSLRLAHGRIWGGDYARRAVQIAQAHWLGAKPWLPLQLSGDVVREIQQRVRGYDLAFYPWPFLLAFPQLDCPSVGIFHDFNYKYYFSGNFVFSSAQRKQLEREVPVWLDSCFPVVSTKFMASELASFYPKAAAKTHVIPLAPLSGVDLIPVGQARETVRQFDLDRPYILYPTHLCSHKNIGPLIAAMALLRVRGHAVRLVLTGAGTEAVRGNAHEIGVRLGGGGGDVLGLGYVSNVQMNSLIQCAAVVVSSSLYEAGNGPGLDAWGCGTPVAMSNIPAFVEHLEVLGVRAQVFDPHCPQDIADKIALILDNPDVARADAEHSRTSMKRMTWDDTAAGYLRVFWQAMQRG
jgi:glycosyltransferase involved in cell wall biosynthesis